MILGKDIIIVVFDGYCVMCSNFVRWLAKLDTEKKIYYTTFESNFLNKNYPELKLIDTVFVIDHDANIHIKTKAIKICLGKIGQKKLLITFFNLMPLKFANLVYNIVAKTRYIFFGKKAVCTVPNDIVKNRILT